MVIWRIDECRLLLQVIYEALQEWKKERDTQAWVRTKTQFFGEVAKYAKQYTMEQLSSLHWTILVLF